MIEVAIELGIDKPGKPERKASWAPYYKQNPNLRRIQARKDAAAAQLEITPTCEFTERKCSYWQFNQESDAWVCMKCKWFHLPCHLDDISNCPLGYPKPLFKGK